MQQPFECAHTRTRLIAEDEHETYIECLDCGAVLERGELSGKQEFPESLSDA